VLRAVLMAGAYPALIALISLGIGAVIRHTAGAICALVGVVFVLPLLFFFFSLGSSIQNKPQKFPPETMRNWLTAIKPVAHMLSPGLTFGLLCAYAMVALAAGAWAPSCWPGSAGTTPWETLTARERQLLARMAEAIPTRPSPSDW
jgi:ABC-2 type transport system permease protein